ncbi:MAG TPA: DUF2256 domain-containing protein [Halomonas sp.]|uniref:DUF2256 domain-containing protein n=2 Tax=Oceanospirillales TaxID=135619 RepID=A0A3D0KHH0_9GAMM|nr:DUF2256 domain-containing protein [Halomonas sp.]HBS83349.1 DUF2256 domain-containing protein [Halomonas campaniensis]HCA02968.1 DUF2256 domain-containing protein [Halomonas campaniensis]
MGPMQRKQDLPQKDCVQCQRPFTWRKKWARCWDEVRHCSERCRREAKQSNAPRRQMHEQHD